MKILFGAGNFIGSNIMLSRFLQHAQDHDVRIAAYYRNHRYLQSIDWCLDALNTRGEKNYFKEKCGITGPPIDHYLADMIVNDLLEWSPDLIISDCEFFTAMLAKVLEVPLWYCSPMLQMIGIEHDRKELNTKILDTTKLYLESLPRGDAYLVYSPLCDISARPLLKRGFEWARPYSTAPKEFTTEDVDLEVVQKAKPNSLVTTGETSFVADCLYAGKPLLITPNPSEIEQVLNAQLMQWYGAAVNIGRSTSTDFIKRQVERCTQKPLLSVQKWSQLDECLLLYADQ
jgi:hypothetical protein